MRFVHRLSVGALAAVVALSPAVGAGDEPPPRPAESFVVSLGKTHAIQVAVLQGGKTLAAYGGDGKLRLWDLTRGDLRGEVEAGRPSNSHNFHFLEPPDGKHVVVAGDFEKVYVVKLDDGTLASSFAIPFDTLPASYALTDGGATLVQLDRGLNYRHFDLKTGKPKEGVKLPAPPKDDTGAGSRANLALAPDGKTYATNDGTCLLRDAATHEVRYRFAPDAANRAFYRNGSYRPRYSADARRVLFQGMDGTLRVVDVGSGKEARVLRLERDPRRPGAPIAPAAFSPDGQWVLATTDSQASELHLFGVASGLEVRRFPGKVVGPHSLNVAIAPGNLLVAPGSAFHQVEVWEIETGRPRPKAPGK